MALNAKEDGRFSRRELLTTVGLIIGAIAVGGGAGIMLYSGLEEQRRIDLARLGPSRMEKDDYGLLAEVVENGEFQMLIPSLEGRTKAEPTIAKWGGIEMNFASLFKSPSQYDSFLERTKTILDVATSKPYLRLGLNSINTLPGDDLSETHLKFYVPSKNVRAFARTDGKFPAGYWFYEDMMPDGKNGYTLEVEATADVLSYAKENSQLSLDGTPFPAPDSNAAINPIYSPQIVVLPIL